MITRFARLLISLGMAVLFASVSLIAANAQDVRPAATTPTPDAGTPAVMTVTYDNCAACHKDVYDNWQLGPHGQAMVDPVFVSIWTEQGKPGACQVCHATGYDPATGKSIKDGVNCEVCHSPIPPNHPVDNMPVDKTPDLCGKCHSDARFATEDWQLSAHYKRSMTCTVCHDPHTAGMKALDNAPAGADASALCANCHKDAMNNFPASKHAEAGVTCVNCHLGFNVDNADPSKVDFITAHRAPDHTFLPSLDTCNKCHSTQMHGTGQAEAAAAIKQEEIGGTPTPRPTAVVTPVPPVENEPAPVSPVGFAFMAGLLGIAAGMVVAPWLERAYRNNSKGEKNG